MPVAKPKPVRNLRSIRKPTTRKLITPPVVTPPRVAVRAISPRTKHEMFEDMPLAKVKIYSEMLLRAIRRDLAGMEFFTREDLIQHPLFSHIATISRYGTVRTLVTYLARRGDIVIKKRTDIFLKDQASVYVEEPLHRRYYDTVATVVRSKFTKRDHFTVMDIVAEWKTDPDQTVNAKRTAIRGSLPRLIRENLIDRIDPFTFRRK